MSTSSSSVEEGEIVGPALPQSVTSHPHAAARNATISTGPRDRREMRRKSDDPSPRKRPPVDTRRDHRRRDRSRGWSSSSSGDGRPRRFSRSRSRSRSRAAWPAATPPPASPDTAARAHLGDLAASIRSLTSATKLSDCIKDLKQVCERLDSAISKACLYCELLEQAGGDFPSELPDLGSHIHGGLSQLHLLSNTGRGREMGAARPVVQRAWRERERLFSSAHCEAMAGWVGSSKNFAGLLEEGGPAAGPAMPAPMPAPPPVQVSLSKSARKKPGRQACIPGVGGREATEENGKGAGIQRVPPKEAHQGQAHTVAQITESEGNENRQVEAHANGSGLPDAGEGTQADGRGVVPGSDVDNLLRAAKLCLVLDLDHTLLNSVMFTEVDAQLGAWLEARAEQHTRLPPEQRMLFRIDEIKMFTKLRPGVHEFLKRAAQHFELWIHTNGNRMYAAAVTRLLDPDGRYFGTRIIAQGAERVEDMQPDQPKSLEQGLAAREAVTIIVDDSHSVWSAHAHNLVTVERYVYFPSTGTQLGVQGRSLLESGRDDHVEHGMLMVTLQVLIRVHTAVFAALDAPPRRLPSGETVHVNWDTRFVLSEERQQVLRGVCIVFSRVIPLGQDPATHPLWQLALRHGARCSTQVTPAMTHLVAGTGGGGTDKAMQARSAGKFVVSPAWLSSCCTMWQRQDEQQFIVH